VLVHLDAAYTLARYLTRRSDIAEDIVQEAVLRAFGSFNKQRGENARSWLLAIVRIVSSRGMREIANSRQSRMSRICFNWM